MLEHGTITTGAVRMPRSHASGSSPGSTVAAQKRVQVGGLVEHEEAPALAEARARGVGGVRQRAVHHRPVHRPVVVGADHPAPPDHVTELHGASMSPPALTAIVRHALVAPDPGSGPLRDGLSRAGEAKQSQIQDPPAAWPVAPGAPYRWTEAMSFERMWAELAPVGRSVRTGGYFRQPYEAADVELRHWFVGEAEARGLRVERDGVGNVIAWWDAGTPGPGVVTGSHLDSVRDGGAYDGPLGVVSGLAAVDLLRERGVAPSRPVGVSVFAEEEGSRFGRACLGSRLAVGAVSWATARELRDRDGVALPDALERAGLDPGPDGPATDLADRVACFVELHVEQGRDLVDRGAAMGVASEIWPHGRYRFEFTGEANHAGTTRMEDRHDPMLSYAMTALAANKQARLTGQRATFGRVDIDPNGTNAVPSRVTAWLDARCESDAALEDLVGDRRPAGDRAGRARRHRADGDGRVRDRGAVASTATSPAGSPRTTRAATGP